MSILTREDGTQFVIQAYRELLSTKKSSLMSQELRLLSDQHGEYVHVHPGSDGQVEVAFSSEMGYLLGESIWEYFGRPRYFIFCEALPGSNEIILVVINNGSVYLDTKIPNRQLAREIAPLTTETQAYEIVTSGDVLLRNIEQAGSFTFPKEQTISFRRLDKLLLPQLPEYPQLQMQPLVLALRSEHFRRKAMPWVIGASLVVLLVAGLFYLTQQTPDTTAVAEKIKENPLALYQSALTSASPDLRLQAFARTVTRLYFLPGWHVTQVHYDQNRYRISVSPNNGSIRLLSDFAQQHGYQMHLNASGAMLTIEQHLQARSVPSNMLSTQKVAGELIDHLNAIMPQHVVAITGQSREGGAEKMNLTIRLAHTSPTQLMLIARTLRDLPVELQAVDVQLKTGLMIGTIRIAVWGI